MFPSGSCELSEQLRQTRDVGWFAGLVFDSSGKARFTVATFVRHGGPGGDNAAPEDPKDPLGAEDASPGFVRNVMKTFPGVPRDIFPKPSK
jgi:hypothetical protein